MGNKRKEKEMYHAKLVKPAKTYITDKNLQENTKKTKMLERNT